jgi:diguanylate cyclase
MLAKALRAPLTARLAVAGLALGLFVLAGLALWGNGRTDRDTARLDQINDIAAAWGTLFETLNAQDAAMADYVNAGDDVGRSPLQSATMLDTSALSWLEQHSESERRPEVARVAEAYRSYTATLTTMVQLGNDGRYQQAAAYARMAALMADTLRKQITANIASRRLQTTAYLEGVKRFNHELKMIGLGVFGIETVLLLLCSAILLGHQRRTERQAAESRHRALHDPLTGLPNRVLLDSRVEAALEAADPTGETLALMLIDLDRFKEVNDTMGHHAGDLLLQVVAERLRRAVRAVDTVARLGGDEFAVLVPGIRDAAEADHLARRLLAALREAAELDGISIDVDGSIGVSLHPAHGTDAKELLRHADIAMYAAKHGRLGTALYTDELGQVRTDGVGAAVR